MLNKLGEELKEARLKTDSTLQQVSTRTRIDLKFLEAMENGNFSFLPELYVKAFLKEYCAFVGLDTAAILKKYDLAKQGKTFDETASAAPAVQQERKPEIIPDVKKEEPKPVKKPSPPPVTSFDAVQQPVVESSASAVDRKKIIIASIVSVLIIALTAVYFLFFYNNTNIVVPEKPYEEVVQEHDKYYEDQKSAPANADTTAHTAAVDSMRLDIKASDTSWVKIMLDDKRSEEFLLFPRSRKTIAAAKNYKITFGKSYAIKLELNGKPLDYKPGKSKVAHIMIDSTGITNLEEPPRYN
jgi:cytoskeletal protein RodZ